MRYSTFNLFAIHYPRLFIFFQSLPNSSSLTDLAKQWAMRESNSVESTMECLLDKVCTELDTVVAKVNTATVSSYTGIESSDESDATPVINLE